ncbi:MAG: T9SS type A sorting domain-containing protein [Flavobacteriales bacterium]|nr:T9SS type A sorting domain-containing protein [Flavobacteriales bacterium]
MQPFMSAATRANRWLPAAMALLLAFSISQSKAQTATIDGGSISGLGPMGTLAHHAGEYLYFSTEIAQDLTITRINFKNAIMAGSNADAYGNVSLYLRHTALTTLPTALYAGTGGYTLVYSGPIVWSKSGWSGADLQTPFAYSQASGNLQLLVVRADAVAHTGTSFYAAVTTGVNSCRRYNNAAAPVVGVSTLTQSTFRAAIQLIGEPNCSGAPTPGNTLFVQGSGCPSTFFSMSLENATPGPDVTYQWESADDAAFTLNVVSLGTHPSQWASQTTDKYYRCLVSCPSSPPAVASNPLFVSTAPGHLCALCAAGVNAGDHFFFEKIDNVAYGTGNTVNNNSADHIGTYQNFRGLVGDVLENNSFDVTVNISNAVASDQVLIWCDWDQNGVFNNDPSELMYTSPTGTGPFTATILVPSGATLGRTTMRIRLHDTAFGPLLDPCGNASYGEVEDYGLNVLPPPTCGLPSGLAAAVATTTTANISWLAAPSAVTYDVELRQGGAPGSGGETFAGSTGALTIVATGLTFGQSYQVYVRADCGGGNLSPWVGPFSHLQDYCATDAPFNNDPVITQFTYAGINNVNAATSGYLNFTAQTAFVEPGAATAFTLDRSTDYPLDSLFIWVDLNDDIDFSDPGELVYTSPALFPDPLNDFITIPNGTSPGDKRMRVRRVNMTPGFGWNSPCGTAPFGQTHDYTVNVCGAPTATASVADDCANDEFTIQVDITSNPQGSLTINWVATPGGPGSQPAALGLNTLPDFPAGTEVSVTVSNGSVCELDLGTHFSNCPVTVTCGSVVTMTHCYTNTDPRVFIFIASDDQQTLTMSFIAGTMDPNDIIRVYAGTDENNSPLLTSGSFSDLGVPQLIIASTTDTIMLVIDSDASNSCTDAQQSTWEFEVDCTPACLDPDGAVAVTTNCGTYDFTIDVEILTTGSGATTTLRYTVNGGTPIDIPGLVDTNVENLGPFAIDDVINIRLLHETDSNCDRNLGNYSDDNTCIPGEACVGAILLSVNGLGGCPAGGTPGSNTGATQDGGLFSCSASVGPFEDKWYRFNSGANSAIAYSFTAFTFASLLVEVFEGGCAGTSVHCALGGSALSNSFVVTPNTDYWLRMASVAPQGGNFTICVSAGVPPPDPCASIANIAACGVSTGPVAAPSGTGAWSNNTLGGPYQTPGVERIFTFSATVTGVHIINVIQYTGGNFIDFYWKQVGTCDNTGWNYLSDLAGIGNVAADVGLGGVPLNFVAGNTYYILWDPENTTGRTVAFEVLCPIPAPANDDCANAIGLTPGATCVPTPGSTIGASQSAAPSTCSTFTSSAANDVWYSFVATRITHRVTVAGLVAFDAIVDLRSGACNGTTVACVDATVNGQTEVLTVGSLNIGETYLVRVYGWAGVNGDFTICVEEPDCNGVFGGGANPGTACDDGNANTVLDAYDANCVCAGQVCTTDLSLELQLDGVSTVSWFLHQEGTDILVQSGVEFLPGPSDLSVGTCLPDGCYYLRVEDDGGDGITGGGYLLRVLNGARLLDNLYDQYGNGGFTSGSVSQVAGGEGFCLPLGTDRLVVTSCDKLDWKVNPCGGEFVVANENAAVSAEYGGPNAATSGYQMWWYQPNGGFSFKRFQSHNTSNGLPNNAVRACHFQLNAWTGNQLQQNVLYNVKVRGRINGVYSNWGYACRLIIDDALAQCPRTKLMDLPGNQFLSCGQTRSIGTSYRVHARNVRRMKNNCAWQNANRYQFRFRIPAENVVILKTSPSGQYFVNTAGLVCGKTYEVDVRASFDNGSTWCVNTPDPSSVTDPAWGDVCELFTVPCAFGMAQEGSGAAATEQRMSLYPNPNTGDQLVVSFSGLPADAEQVRFEMHDAFGKLVLSRTIPVQEGMLNSTVSLDGRLSAGLYMATLNVQGITFTERVVVQP